MIDQPLEPQSQEDLDQFARDDENFAAGKKAGKREAVELCISNVTIIVDAYIKKTKDLRNKPLGITKKEKQDPGMFVIGVLQELNKSVFQIGDVIIANLDAGDEPTEEDVSVEDHRPENT